MFALMSSSSSTRPAYAAWVAVCLLWGTTYLAIRIALETIPPMLMGGIRWTTAGAVILGVMKLRGDPIPHRDEWPSLALLGILLIGLGNGGVVWAEQTLPSGLTSVLVAVIPFWMVGVERLAGDAAPITVRRTIGLVVGFGGIVLLVWPELELGEGRAFLLGVLATQVACLGWAIGSSYSRRRRPAENVLAVAAYQMLFGGLAMFAAGLLHSEWPLLWFNPRTSAAIVYLVVFGSLGGFTAYAYALKHLPVATVSLYAYVNPVIAMLLGTLVLSEPLSPRLAVAGAVVLMGMALVRR
ncbi:MAG TPA: EamA family transporter [Vicinamibacterales bacterium]|nr:EamA family transporter [Vicinamibacterales bacterium]